MPSGKMVDYADRDGGWYNYSTHSGVPGESTKCLDHRHVREDTYKALPGGPFIVNKLTIEGGRLNLPWWNYFATYFGNYVVDGVRGEGLMGNEHLYTGAPSNGGEATRLLASTNPSRPHVDAGIAIAELREVPRLFAEVVKGGLLRKASDVNLRYQFGVVPVFNDFLRFLDFTNAFDARVAEIEKFRTQGNQSKKSSKKTFRAARIYKEIVQSFGAFIFTDVEQHTEETVWGWTIWYPDANFPQSSEEVRAYVTKSFYGLTLDFSTLWELIPWSWLVDWCSNVGDFLSAQRNIIPVTPTTPCVMRHKKTTWEGGGHPVGERGGSLERFKVTLESKSRDRANASLDAQWPILDNRQLSILGSLAILRGSR